MAAQAESQPSPQPAAPVLPSWTLATALGMFVFWVALNVVIPLTSISISLLLHRFDPADWQRIIDDIDKDPWAAVADAACTLLVWIVTFSVLEAWFRRFPRDQVRKSLALIRPDGGWRVVALAGLLGGVLGVLAMEIQSIFQTPESADPFNVFMTTAVGRVSLVFVAVILAPAAEELFFRGFLMPPMERLGVQKYGARRGLVLAVIFNAVLFAAAHSFQYGVSELVELLMVGIVLSTLRVWSGSVWPAIVAHLSYNAFQIVLALGGSS